jgi:hypothetical protein
MVDFLYIFSNRDCQHACVCFKSHFSNQSILHTALSTLFVFDSVLCSDRWKESSSRTHFLLHLNGTSTSAHRMCLLTPRPAVMTKSYDSVLGSSTRAWKLQRMELVLQYSRSSAWPHPISVVLELVTTCVLHALGSKWTARSGSLSKIRDDVGSLNPEAMMSRWEAFYKSDKCMAAMHQEVYHEAVPGLNHRDNLDSEPNYLKRRAEYMRGCADLAVRMTTKRNASHPCGS